VRRILAFALVALFSFSLIEPLAFASDPTSKLPACCRRLGKHHCEMVLAELQSSSGPSFESDPCQSFPLAKATTASPDAALMQGALTGSVAMLSHAAVLQPSDSADRIAFRSTCQKRGPPRSSLS
jgi:hypothetical protein